MEEIDLDDYDQFKKLEKSIGIECYSTSTSPIGGIIKSDLADFIVREILPSGEILRTYEQNHAEIPFNSKDDKYTHFTLVKRNMDTIYAAKLLQEYLDLPEEHITWAGIKDNNAITAQRFSVKGNFYKKLQKFTNKKITLTDIRPGNRPVLLGQLWGNHFDIIIRKIYNDFSSLAPTLSKWKDEINQVGFPNYYGVQRFGHHRPNSHIVGKYVFLGEFEKAVEEFLYRSYPLEYDTIQQFRNQLGATKDFAWGLQAISPSLGYEKMILRSLVHDPTDFRKAFFNLPLSLINLILSSYQSFLFNRAISQRILNQDLNSVKNYPQKGDIVAILTEPRGQPSLVFYKFGGWNDDAILKAFHYDRAAIVAPILGYDTDLSYFESFKPIYDKLLADENFSQEKFHLSKSKLFEFRGTFRPIFQKPSRLEVEQGTFHNPSHSLDPNGIFLRFSLPKGTYATLLLRELIK
jgi:tRNA pseudouridine13 synthase